jgi:hypothetical protein
VVVVVARTEKDGNIQLLVAPITHSEPQSKGAGIELPPRVKRHLGLDEERNWIILTELNRFIWPGPDIRPAPTSGSPLYGALPAKLFEQVRNGIMGHSTAGKLSMTKRSE